MSMFSSGVDTNFYQLIHDLFPPQKGEFTEGRRKQRVPYSSHQRIAPRVGDAFPPESAFLDVQCNDLTPRGFSFLLPDKPAFTSLVIEFSTIEQQIYIGADVRWSKVESVDPSRQIEHPGQQGTEGEQPSSDGQAGRPMYLVGCHFTDRLEYPNAADA